MSPSTAPTYPPTKTASTASATSTGSQAPTPDDELVVAGATVGVTGVVSGDPGVPFPGVVFPGVAGTVDAVGGGRVVAVAPGTSGSLGSALPPAVLAAWLLGVGSKRCVQPIPLR